MPMNRFATFDDNCYSEHLIMLNIQTTTVRCCVQEQTYERPVKIYWSPRPSPWFKWAHLLFLYWSLSMPPFDNWYYQVEFIFLLKLPAVKASAILISLSASGTILTAAFTTTWARYLPNRRFDIQTRNILSTTTHTHMRRPAKEHRIASAHILYSCLHHKRHTGAPHVCVCPCISGSKIMLSTRKNQQQQKPQNTCWGCGHSHDYFGTCRVARTFTLCSTNIPDEQTVSACGPFRNTHNGA